VSADVAKPDRVVVLDWYGTLAMPNRADFWGRLPALVVEAGGVVDATALAEWEGGSPLEHDEHSSSEEAYRAWQGDRLALLLQRCRIPDRQAAELLARIEHWRYTSFFDVYPEVRQVLSELKESGLRLGVCSNWEWDLDRQLRHNDLSELLDFVVCSAVVGCRKPHRRIFQKVIEAAETEAASIVFVGDSWPDDVLGARAAGMAAVHVARQPCDVSQHSGAPCVSGLRQLPEVIARSNGWT
jgi:putative hydrolase of the HAD superfamily